MKKIVFIICLIIISSGLYIYLYNRNLITITIDINPSIEIKMTKDKKVKSLKALNKDAHAIIDNKLKGLNIEKVIDIISNKLIENDYIHDDRIIILMHADKYDNIEELKNKFYESLKSNDVEIIIISKVTNEDWYQN